MNIWQLQEAKAHLSEMVRLCLSAGPQILTIRGKEEAILLYKKEYEKLLGKKPALTDLMQNSPLKDVEFTVERDKSEDRDL
ncbi:Phd_YefM antitoxin protein (plasmid) [Rickettsiales bacterium Ac37b]|nr:Phd_YefM antitoxin protein [Rickettsiales bacterium Ac37b]